MTEKEKSLKGLLYDPFEKELTEKRTIAHNLCRKYNLLDDGQVEERNAVLKEITNRIRANK